MQVEYSQRFLRQLCDLPRALQEEVYIAVDKLQDVTKHKSLAVHKLRGRLRDAYVASVNYKIRLIFFHPPGKVKRIHFIAVGDHEVYGH